MAFCTDCGFRLPDKAAFCPNCGQSLNAAGGSAKDSSGETGAAGTGSAENRYYGAKDGGFIPPSYERPETGYVQSNNDRYGYYGANSTNNNPSYNNKSGDSKTAIIAIASVLVLLVVAVVLIVQFASKNSDSQANATPGSDSAEATSDVQPAKNNSVSGSGYVENESYYISFIGAEQFTDVDNQAAIRIYYEFTNNFEYPQSAWYSLDWTATQDGRALEVAYAWEDEDAYYYDTLNIRTGLMIQCYLQFKYNPGGGKVDLTIFGWESGESGGKVSCTYVPGSLPGAPSRYEFDEIREPQWTTKLDSEGYLDEGDYYASVIDAELITDYEGNPAIRVYYEFTNNTQTSVSMYNALYMFTYQDGVELFKTYASAESAADENFYAEVDSGKTITASCVFQLRNGTSNVEAEIEGALSYYAIGNTFKVS